MSGVVEILLILAVVLVATAVVVVLVLRFRQTAQARDTTGWQLLQQQINDSAARRDEKLDRLNQQLTESLSNLTRNLNQQLSQTHQLSQQTQKIIGDRLDSTGKTITQVHSQLGELGQAARNIAQVGTEVRKLQDILQSPKSRGSLGEWSLENLLAEVLPRQHYELQYRFQNGTIVDALVKLAQGSVAIDAKFPLPNFQALLEADEQTRPKLRRAFLRDVCQRIDEIADKYILPDEGTLDFALMYVPAENVYYEATIIRDPGETDVCAHGRARKVIPVSPNILYAYLMVIATGLKGLQIEKNAHLIRQQLSRLTTDLQSFINDFAIVGKHVTNAQTRHQEAAQKLDRLQLRLSQMETDAEQQ